MQDNKRYIRQMILPGFGVQAQNKLRDAKVLIIGMGGLGCPALQYLVGAGIGHIGIMDADVVSMSNLHRQLLFSATEIGMKKVDVAAAKMKWLDPETQIAVYPFLLTNQNALDIIERFDIVIDGTDNFTAKYIINDACVILGKPFVYGAVSSYEGQVSVFNVSNKKERAVTYRDLFPVPPLPGEIQSCEEAGVLGALPGIIGTMQAAEVIKMITGIGYPLSGRLYNFDLLQGRGYEIKLSNHPDTIMIDRESFEQMNYDFDCGEMDDITEINIAEFIRLSAQPNVFVLDVRERHEYPVIDFSDAQIPMSELQTSMANLPEKEICVICHQGIRSVYAAQLIKAKRNLTVYSLKGGLTAYFNQSGL
jgi:molybdopterin/thiamine biosynthesis adenylyltransferase/rhodanese-related sulfurtransferase